jgi:hypothetical protein
MLCQQGHWLILPFAYPTYVISNIMQLVRINVAHVISRHSFIVMYGNLYVCILFAWPFAWWMIGVCVLGKGMVLRRDAAILTGFQHELHNVECQGAYVVVRLKVHIYLYTEMVSLMQ